MKGARMKMKNVIYLCIIVLISLWCVGRAHADNKFNLKQGAKGEVCLTCHTNFESKLKKSFIHTPVKQGDCTGCHSPHASSHGKLLTENTEKICFTCHPTIVPEAARSTHRVVSEGTCVKCHDPHGSDNKFNLVRGGNDLCFGCHTDMKAAVSEAKNKHAPVNQACVTCHDPHGSATAVALLRDSVPKLCTNCHETSKQLFKKVHMDYPVENARCTTCHAVHGSDKPGILYNNVHPPVANRLCSQCHEGPGSRNPLATKRVGYELCKSCHNNKVSEIFGKKRFHWAIFGEKACNECHAPHASKERNLLKAPEAEVCGECHQDTVERSRTVKEKHNPVKEGLCTYCHDPHSSDNLLLITRPSIIELCGSCHDWQKHATHPIGAKIIDKRNPNLSVDCLSCHRSHGTDSKYIVHFTTINETCVQCHKELRR